MSKLGFGVMIGILSGNDESVKAFSAALGKTITSIKLTQDSLRMGFEDGSAISLYDDGQSCCESRYMTCDDNLQEFVGARLLDGEIKEAPDVPAEYETHEVQFLVITTSLGAFTVESHNEHNGYYGGFCIRATVDETAPTSRSGVGDG